MEYKKITEKYQDLSNIWRIRVLIDDFNTIFLNFNHDPTETEVKNRTELYIKGLMAEESNAST